MSLWAILLIAVIAVPPLTDAQRARLDTAVDDSARLDESALYPLLENVLTWEDHDEAGAAVPDYNALLADPVVSRGEVFLIEGKFAGRARRYKLVRTGGWGDSLTEWVLLVGDDPEQVAVIYFVDPDDELTPPRTGSHVRVVARFYKVWADRDQTGKATRYLTFVARSPWATIAGGGAGVSGGGGTVLSALPMLGAIVALVGVYIVVRRIRRPSSVRLRPTGHPAGSGDDAMLSQDPAEALRRLAEQRDEP